MNAFFTRYSDHYRIVVQQKHAGQKPEICQALVDAGWYESHRSRRGEFHPFLDNWQWINTPGASRYYEFDRDGSGILGVWNVRQYDEFLIPARQLLLDHGYMIGETVDRRDPDRVFFDSPARI